MCMHSGICTATLVLTFIMMLSLLKMQERPLFIPTKHTAKTRRPMAKDKAGIDPSGLE